MLIESKLTLVQSKIRTTQQQGDFYGGGSFGGGVLYLEKWTGQGSFSNPGCYSRVNVEQFLLG